MERAHFERQIEQAEINENNQNIVVEENWESSIAVLNNMMS